MNVRELIDALQLVENKELDISTEGCDCYNYPQFVVEENTAVYLEFNNKIPNQQRYYKC